jgi:uncharacterized protein (DUF983 family)
MILPAGNGNGGKGKLCANCGKYQVFTDKTTGATKCRGCGAEYKKPD